MPETYALPGNAAMTLLGAVRHRSAALRIMDMDHGWRRE
jgi:hypothetical protein